jgi:hypothetical protein
MDAFSMRLIYKPLASFDLIFALLNWSPIGVDFAAEFMDACSAAIVL